MTNWQHSILGAIEGVEARYDRLLYRLGHFAGGPASPIIVPYRSYGNNERLLLRGRVLKHQAVRSGLAADSVWKNLLNTYRRLESDEVPGARVGAVCGSAHSEGYSDEEGHVELWLECPEMAAPGGWIDVDLHLLDPSPAGRETNAFTVEVLVPPATARFGVISDIDDTVMRSYATELLRMAKLTFLGNAQTRLPFPGVAAFYRALHNGVGGMNPIFYVSSSPWNLYDLLIDFLRLQNIPRGPMFLRDWGIEPGELLPTEHSTYKLTAIERLFEFYDELPFILIGDSGQEDPEIYAEIVRRYPQRVLALYVRDVSPAPLRDEAILELAKEVSASGSSLILAEDTLVMAQHAADNGWIDATTLNAIVSEIESDSDDAI